MIQVTATKETDFSIVKSLFFKSLQNFSIMQNNVIYHTHVLSASTSAQSFPKSLLQAFILIVVQSLSGVQFFATLWTEACQISLSFTIFQNLLKLMSIESVMPSNPLIFCRSLLLLPSIFPSIRIFSNVSALHIGWPKYWSFSFSILPMKIQS